MQQITYICDECGEMYEADAGIDIKEAWELAKEIGWVCFKEDDEWRHKCDECCGEGK